MNTRTKKPTVSSGPKEEIPSKLYSISEWSDEEYKAEILLQFPKADKPLELLEQVEGIAYWFLMSKFEELSPRLNGWNESRTRLEQAWRCDDPRQAFELLDYAARRDLEVLAVHKSRQDQLVVARAPLHVALKEARSFLGPYLSSMEEFRPLLALLLARGAPRIDYSEPFPKVRRERTRIPTPSKPHLPDQTTARKSDAKEYADGHRGRPYAWPERDAIGQLAEIWRWYNGQEPKLYSHAGGSEANIPGGFLFFCRLVLSPAAKAAGAEPMKLDNMVREEIARNLAQ